MPTFTFNSTKYNVGPIVDKGLIWTDLVNQPMFKYADYKFAYKNSIQTIKDILETCPTSSNYKYKLVDVKIHSLKAGECPCVFGWHLDGYPDPFVTDKVSKYHLYLIGPKFSRTLFIDHPVTLEVDHNPDNMNNSYVRQLANMPIKYSHLPDLQWCSYTNEDFHSGPKVTSAANRLLIRVVETNHILPRNKIMKP